MVQRRMFLQGNCNDFWLCALLIRVANGSEQRESTLLGSPAKGGIIRGRQGHFQGQTLSLDEFTAQSFGARF